MLIQPLHINLQRGGHSEGGFKIEFVDTAPPGPFGGATVLMKIYIGSSWTVCVWLCRNQVTAMHYTLGGAQLDYDYAEEQANNPPPPAQEAA